MSFRLKFKKGETVKIHSKLREDTHYYMKNKKENGERIFDFANVKMIQFKGSLANIIDVSEEGYTLDVCPHFTFTDGMLAKYVDHLAKNPEISKKYQESVDDVVESSQFLYLNNMIDKSLAIGDKEKFIMYSEELRGLKEKYGCGVR